jgi:hypothetical protein
MEPEGSSPYTQEPATCPYPEPDQSGLCPPHIKTLFLFSLRIWLVHDSVVSLNVSELQCLFVLSMANFIYH